MRIPRVIALICGLALLAACTATPQAKDQSVRANTGFVTLKLLVPAYRNPIFDDLVNAFQQKHPTIRIDQVKAPDNLTSVDAAVRLLKDQVNSGAADVITDPNLVQIDQGMLDLDPYIQKTGFDLKPFGSLDKLRQSGKLYLLPTERMLQVLVYNKDLFAGANVAPPKAGWTWDDFRGAAQKIASQQPGKIWGFVAAQPHMLAGLYAGVGGDSESYRAGVGFTANLIAGDKSMPVPPDNPWGIMSITPFWNGQAGMALVPLNSLQPGVRANWDYAPLPTRPGHPAQPIVNASSIGITAQSKHPDEAWELVTFLSGPEGSALAAQEGMLFSYMTPAVRDAWFSRNPAPSPTSEFLFTPQWAPQWLEPQPKLSPAQAAEVAALQDKANQAMRQVFTDAGHWEAHYADFYELGKQITSLTKRP